MHIDARNLENNTTIEGDICIIGAGAAGISMALDLMNSKYKVVLLEGGGFEYDDKVQQLYAGKTTGQTYYPLKSSRLHYFGGTTGHWAGMCSPLDPIDFVKRDWVPDSGWPINKKDLDPFYAKAQEKLQVGEPYEYDLHYWEKKLPNLNAFPFNKEVVWNKMWQYSQAHFNEAYQDAIKQAKNIHLYTYANVVDIIANEGITAINQVTTKNYAGKTHKVKAKHFVLACGAMQNARLLLAANSQTVNGLGNDNDLVGRYFMEHLEIPSAELWLFRPFPTDLYTWTYGETRASAELAITPRVQEREKILNGTVGLKTLAQAKNEKSRIELWQDEDPRKALENVFKNWEAAEKKAKLEKTGNVSWAYQLDTRIEQAPNPNSRVTLGAEKDELGVPRTQLHWELTALDKRSIRKIYQIIGQQVGIAGIGRLKLKEFLRDHNDDKTWPEDTNPGWHHMGTTRMSDDPKKGVVDVNCQVHGIPNLFVAGSACYPTSGAPNPTLTLVALSLRLSNHLRNILS